MFILYFFNRFVTVQLHLGIFSIDIKSKIDSSYTSSIILYFYNLQTNAT